MKGRNPIVCESCQVSAPARKGAPLSAKLVAGAVVGLLVLIFFIWHFA